MLYPDIAPQGYSGIFISLHLLFCTRMVLVSLPDSFDCVEIVRSSLFACAPRPGPMKYVVLVIDSEDWSGIPAAPLYVVNPKGDKSNGM